jgi:hypothetical protein
MTSYRLFPSTNGPSTPSDFGSNFISAVGFQVTQETIYFEGYWWWVCATQQSTAPQKFCLWQDVQDADLQGENGVLVAASVVESGTLQAGQWNWVPLPAPIPLSQYVSYRAATASPRYAPATNWQFGVNNGQAGPYAAGITNGPLFAFADSSSGNSADVSYYQSSNCTFATGPLDPTAAYPNSGYQAFNLWMDVQVTSTVPSGATFRCWPNQPNQLYTPEATLPYTVSTQMAVSQPAQVLKLWFMSQAGNQALPSVCGIWDTVTQTVVPNSKNSAPAWLVPGGSAGAPGAGWVYCDLSQSGVVLQANRNYRVAVGQYTPNLIWYSGAQGYWLPNGGGYRSTGSGADHGAGNGIIACVPCGIQPNPLSPCAQDTSGGWAYPNDMEDDGDNYYVDLEVVPGGMTTGGTPVNSGAFLAFFP